jgi:hypothetical protein
VLAILAAIFVNGTNTQEAEGRVDNAVFIEYLDEYHMLMLVQLLLGEEREFIDQEWDFSGWVTDAISVFFKYNNFFALIRKVGEMVQGMGLTETDAKAALVGQKNT